MREPGTVRAIDETLNPNLSFPEFAERESAYGNPERNPMDQLRAMIELLRVDAKVLLLRAQHEEMKAHVRTVQRDLEEALGLLDQPSAVPESRLAVLDAAVKSASLRLQMVEFALRAYGPNASEIR